MFLYETRPVGQGTEKPIWLLAIVMVDVSETGIGAVLSKRFLEKYATGCIFSFSEML